jgi:hypothetical protein
VLHSLLRVIEARLRLRSGCARGRLGAVSFVQRFGSALNAHVHFHCCVCHRRINTPRNRRLNFPQSKRPILAA